MNVTLVHLNDSSTKVFVRGLLKGMASPAALFGVNRAQMHHVELPPLPTLPPFEPVRIPHSLTTQSDLERLGIYAWTAASGPQQQDPQAGP